MFRPRPVSTTTTVAVASISHILVFDTGRGFRVLWTLDGQVWIDASHGLPYNAGERDLVVERLREHHPHAQVRGVEDFYCRIPVDLRTPHTRVL